MNQARTSLAFTAMTVALCGACTTTSGPAEVVDFPADLGAICAATTARLDELARPPEASIAEFGNAVSAALTSEADQARELDPPADARDDHRAFVRNTDEQAAAWVRLADSTPEELADVTAEIGSLTLGRDDLVVAMGIEACRRSEL